MPVINIKRNESYFRDVSDHDANCPCTSLSKAFSDHDAYQATKPVSPVSNVANADKSIPVAKVTSTDAEDAHDHLKALFDDRQIKYLHQISEDPDAVFTDIKRPMSSGRSEYAGYQSGDQKLQIASWRRTARPYARPVRKRCATRTGMPAMSVPLTENPQSRESFAPEAVSAEPKVELKSVAPRTDQNFSYQYSFMSTLGPRECAFLVPLLLVSLLMTSVMIIAAVKCTKTVVTSKDSLKPQQPAYPWLGSEVGLAHTAQYSHPDRPAQYSDQALAPQFATQPVQNVPEVSAQSPGSFPQILEPAPRQDYGYRTPPQVRIYTY